MGGWVARDRQALFSLPSVGVGGGAAAAAAGGGGGFFAQLDTRLAGWLAGWLPYLASHAFFAGGGGEDMQIDLPPKLAFFPRAGEQGRGWPT